MNNLIGKRQKSSIYGKDQKCSNCDIDVVGHCENYEDDASYVLIALCDHHKRGINENNK